MLFLSYFAYLLSLRMPGVLAHMPTYSPPIDGRHCVPSDASTFTYVVLVHVPDTFYGFLSRVVHYRVLL
jgi:hypothetical protein